MTGSGLQTPLQARYERPTDLRVVLGPLRRGRADPTLRFGPDGVWRASLTPLGPGTLHLVARSSFVEATAWGPGASWLLDTLPQLLGADDTHDGFDHTRHPLVADLFRRHGEQVRLLRTQLVWEALLPAILEQKVTGKQARSAFGLLASRTGMPAPGPAPAGMVVLAPADVWRLIPSWAWHGADVDPQRARTVLRAAAVAPALERTLSLGRGGLPVAALLRQVPGIGVWTAAEVTQRAHGDPDSPSFGDYHVAAAVGWALIGKPVDDDGMAELLEPWAGHRQRVVRLLELGGPAKPRFGPRLNPEDHRAR